MRSELHERQDSEHSYPPSSPLVSSGGIPSPPTVSGLGIVGSRYPPFQLWVINKLWGLWKGVVLPASCSYVLYPGHDTPTPPSKGFGRSWMSTWLCSPWLQTLMNSMMSSKRLETAIVIGTRSGWLAPQTWPAGGGKGSQPVWPKKVHEAKWIKKNYKTERFGGPLWRMLAAEVNGSVAENIAWAHPSRPVNVHEVARPVPQH